jgi:hypothetical protein
MSSVAGLNNFNNLLYNTRKRAVADKMEHLAGHIGMDLSYKPPSRIGELLTAKVSQINGKHSDLKYVPTSLHSRPYGGYDARYDPTLLNSVCNKYVDVSGLLIPNRNLSYKAGDMTTRPYRAYSIIQ